MPRSSRLFVAVALGGVAAIALSTLHRVEATAAPDAPPTSVLDFELERIDGSSEPLSTYRGRVLMLVNVASKCGFTPQYEGLETLYERYRDRGFEVLGFPANDFADQEPGSNEEIAEFCRATWGVRFPMFGKITVRGEEQHPLYRFITSRPAPIGGPIEWNFQKFLVDREGRLVERYAPRTKPLAPEVVERIEALLAAEADGDARPDPPILSR